MDWQTYAFEDLPNLTRTQLRANEEIARLAPGSDGERVLRSAIGRVLQELKSEDEPPLPHEDDPQDRNATHVALPDRLRVAYAGLASESDWSAGPYIVRAHISLGSNARRALIEVPLLSVRSLISRVVGVPAERLGASDILTPVEQGVFAYFVERMTRGLSERVPFLSPLLPMSVQEIASENGTVDWGNDGAAAWYAVSGTVLVTGMPLPFRVLLPWTLLRETRQRYEAGSESLNRKRRLAVGAVGSLGAVTCTLTGRIGALTLNASELERIEPSDIVLLDEFEACSVDRGRIQGRIGLAHAGCGPEAGWIHAEVVSDHDHRLEVRAIELVPGSEGVRERRMNMSTGHDPEQKASGQDPASTSPGTNEGRALAEDAPVTLRVEIGRVRLTLREVSQLSSGSVLELHRDVREPVSLVLNDRVLGKGELVRIEGELGVRILSLS